MSSGTATLDQPAAVSSVAQPTASARPAYALPACQACGGVGECGVCAPIGAGKTRKPRRPAAGADPLARPRIPGREQNAEHARLSAAVEALVRPTDANAPAFDRHVRAARAALERYLRDPDPADALERAASELRNADWHARTRIFSQLQISTSPLEAAALWAQLKRTGFAVVNVAEGYGLLDQLMGQLPTPRIWPSTATIPDRAAGLFEQTMRGLACYRPPEVAEAAPNWRNAAGTADGAAYTPGYSGFGTFNSPDSLHNPTVRGLRRLVHDLLVRPIGRSMANVAPLSVEEIASARAAARAEYDRTRPIAERAAAEFVPPPADLLSTGLQRMHDESRDALGALEGAPLRRKLAAIWAVFKAFDGTDGLPALAPPAELGALLAGGGAVALEALMAVAPAVALERLGVRIAAAAQRFMATMLEGDVQAVLGCYDALLDEMVQRWRPFMAFDRRGKRIEDLPAGMDRLLDAAGEFWDADNLRRAAEDLEAADARDGRLAYAQTIIDRMAYRAPGDTATAEAWHRDMPEDGRPETAKRGLFVQTAGEQVTFGGWVNFDRSRPTGGDYWQQTLVCIPCSHARHTLYGQGGGFARVRERARPGLSSREVRIAIPPGCMLIFNESLVHSVVSAEHRGWAGTERLAAEPMQRIFTGFCLSPNPAPLLHSEDSIRRALAEQDVFILKSGQAMRMFPQMAMPGKKERIERWAAVHIKPAVLAAIELLRADVQAARNDRRRPNDAVDGPFYTALCPDAAIYDDDDKSGMAVPVVMPSLAVLERYAAAARERALERLAADAHAQPDEEDQALARYAPYADDEVEIYLMRPL